MSALKCKKCGAELFKINIIHHCGNCEHNAAWDDAGSGYTTDLEIIESKNLDRTQVEDEGECRMGQGVSGDGCYMLTCAICGGWTDHLPVTNY